MYRTNHFAPTGQHPSHRVLWFRWVIWLLVLCVPMQASAAALARAQGPAHFHVQSDVPDNDPMLDLVRVVQNHHGTGQHQHTQIERHRHDADANNVIPVGDDAPDDDAMKSADGKRAAANLDVPIVVAVKAHVHTCVAVALAEPVCAFSSHIAALLERPPR